jgi:hypothetical protein
MTPRSPEPEEFAPLSPDLQVRFWTRLQVIRNEYLGESLSQTVRALDIAQLDRELADFVGAERLAALAACTLRGETWYPVPYVLRAKPLLIGYYRLLYGISQKQFSKRPFGQFAPMEGSNRLSPANDRMLPALCRSLIITGGELFNGVQPVSASAIHDLQLLTIGPQLRGSENNLIGEDATRAVFALIEGLVRQHLESSTSQALVVRNAAQRVVRIAFASDPDIAIIEALPTQSVTSVSIEIKGGTDVSNVHNRIGEAEKSHQKAKQGGCTQFWTILKAAVDRTAAREESPTTTAFFNLAEILDKGSPSHARFRDLLYQAVGIG